MAKLSAGYLFFGIFFLICMHDWLNDTNLPAILLLFPGTHIPTLRSITILTSHTYIYMHTSTGRRQAHTYLLQVSCPFPSSSYIAFQWQQQRRHNVSSSPFSPNLQFHLPIPRLIRRRHRTFQKGGENFAAAAAAAAAHGAEVVLPGAAVDDGAADAFYTVVANSAQQRGERPEENSSKLENRRLLQKQQR